MTDIQDISYLQSEALTPFARPHSGAQPREHGDSGFWDSLAGTTIKLAAVFWTAVLLTDSILWGVAGVDPVRSFFGKLIIDSFGALLTLIITGVLYRFRNSGILTKVGLAFAFSSIAAPLFSLIDFAFFAFCISPKVPVFDWHMAGVTMVSSFGTFFGWSCLFISLLYSFEVQDRERRLAFVREEALTAQMRALRYQISPHFLFNTLNSIAGLIEEGSTKRAERMVISLSTFLRTTLTLDPMSDVTLAEELMLQEEYLEIERERFPDRMDFSIDAAASTKAGRVPSLILQPLIENAVKHGLSRSIKAITISIRARRHGDRLFIAVENDLNASNHSRDSSSQGFGIGLRNVAGRIRARYGDNGRFTAGMTTDQHFRAEIDVPWQAA